MSTVLGRDLTMTLGENSPMVTGVTTTPGGRSPNLTFSDFAAQEFRSRLTFVAGSANL